MPILKLPQQHKLLLDTHILIWMLTGIKKFKKEFVDAIDQNLSHENILFSAISVWEIGMLAEKKRIDLSMDSLEWIEEVFNTTAITLVPLSPRIAIQSSRLPGKMHGDPADRILIATAYENHAALVTHDEKLIEYGKDRFIAVYDPVF